jgi:hypothetical protein
MLRCARIERSRGPRAVGRNRLIAPLRADPYANGPMCRKPPQIAQCASLIAPSIQDVGWVEPLRNPSLWFSEGDGFRFATHPTHQFVVP